MREKTIKSRYSILNHPHINLWDEKMGYLGTAEFKLTLQVKELEEGIEFILPIKRYVFQDLYFPADYWEIFNIEMVGISSISFDDINYLEDLFKAGWDYESLKMMPTEKTEVKNVASTTFLPIIFEDGVWA